MCDQIFENEYLKICSNLTMTKHFSANFDLIISPVSLSDDALYQCQVTLLEIYAC